ncbi:MAG: hypothetical protein WC438_01545 [Candidatus Pacearchaeota archaeon]
MAKNFMHTVKKDKKIKPIEQIAKENLQSGDLVEFELRGGSRTARYFLNEGKNYKEFVTIYPETNRTVYSRLSGCLLSSVIEYNRVKTYEILKRAKSQKQKSQQEKK